MAVLYLVVFGSWVGYTAYIWLLKHVSTQKVATYAYVNPIVAVFLGWLVLHERFDRYIFAGSVVIVAAVALVTTAKVHTGEASRSIWRDCPSSNRKSKGDATSVSSARRLWCSPG